MDPTHFRSRQSAAPAVWLVGGLCLLIAGLLTGAAAVLRWRSCLGMGMSSEPCVIAQDSTRDYLLPQGDLIPVPGTVGVTAAAILVLAFGWFVLAVGVVVRPLVRTLMLLVGAQPLTYGLLQVSVATTGRPLVLHDTFGLAWLATDLLAGILVAVVITDEAVLDVRLVLASLAVVSYGTLREAVETSVFAIAQNPWGTPVGSGFGTAIILIGMGFGVFALTLTPHSARSTSTPRIPSMNRIASR